LAPSVPVFFIYPAPFWCRLASGFTKDAPGRFLIFIRRLEFFPHGHRKTCFLTLHRFLTALTS